MKAVLLISHGSRFPETEQEVKGFVERLKKQSNIPIIEYAFLEIAHPSIPEGMDICVKKGASEVTVLLNFLNAGKHVDEDIPRIVEEASRKYAGVTFAITPPIGKHHGIVQLFLDMIENSGQ
jgi:sirohydrochlorin ferrochelatase